MQNIWVFTYKNIGIQIFYTKTTRQGWQVKFVATN